MPPIDAVTAERLLAGDRTDRERLADLLALAAGPAIPVELAGEQQAMSAFRHARDAAIDAMPGRSRMLARWLTVKAAALALAGTATGIALATAAGVLPSPLDGAPQMRTDTAAPSQEQGTTMPPAFGAGGATPAVSLVGPCAAYVAAVETNGDQTLDDAAFARLIQVAGARESVPGFCDALLRDSSDTDVDAGAPTEPSSGQGNPAHHPTGPPNPHPVGPPTNAGSVAQASPNVQIGPLAGTSGSGSRGNAHGPRGANEGGGSAYLTLRRTAPPDHIQAPLERHRVGGRPRPPARVAFSDSKRLPGRVVPWQPPCRSRVSHNCAGVVAAAFC